MSVAIFGCGVDEQAVFLARSPEFAITPLITSAPVSHDNIDFVAGSRCISVGHKSVITTAHLDALHAAGVRYISTRSIGVNHIDVDYATSIGITVENIAYSPDSVADYTLLLMLMTLRDTNHMLLRVDTHDYRLSPRRGRELRDQTVGVIGTGRIGAAVVDRLQGFGCTILAHDSSERTVAEYVSLAELLERSDIVTLHMPLYESTYHLLDAERLAQLKPGAIVINTGRGPLIDSAALADAIESGHLGGAALDVVEGEDDIFYHDRRETPLDESAFTRLHRLPNVVITPHTAYYTDHALSDTVVNSLINCLSFEKGLQHV